MATLASPDASAYHSELARARVELSATTAAFQRQSEMLAKGVGREYEKVAAEMAVKGAEERVRAAKRDVALLGKSFGGTVIVGHGGAVSADTRGYVTAYDAETGKQLWRFYTVPGDPAKSELIARLTTTPRTFGLGCTG